jgi:hypothetical protein
MPGMVASEVLGVLLSAQCIIPMLWPPGMMPPEMRTAAIEHLARIMQRFDGYGALGAALV